MTREVSARRVVLPSEEWRNLLVQELVLHGSDQENAELLAGAVLAGVCRRAGWTPPASLLDTQKFGRR